MTVVKEKPSLNKWTKTNLRAEEGIFVGYVLGYKIYRILKSETTTVKISSVVYIDKMKKPNNREKLDINVSTSV